MDYEGELCTKNRQDYFKSNSIHETIDSGRSDEAMLSKQSLRGNGISVQISRSGKHERRRAHDAKLQHLTTMCVRIESRMKWNGREHIQIIIKRDFCFRI